MANGPRFSPTAIRRAFAFLSCAMLALFLTGCFEMNAAISIAQDSKVRLSADYSVSALVYPLLTEDGGGFEVKHPLNRSELDALVSGVSGARVVSYSEAATSMKRSFSVALDFPNPESLCSFLTAAAGGASFLNSNGKRQLAITIPCPAVRADEELVSSLEVLFGEYDITLRVGLPSAVLSSPAGKAEAKSAVFETRMIDLVKSGKNAVWAVSW